MKKISELLASALKQQQIKVEKAEYKIFKPEYVEDTSKVSQKFLDGEYSVSFYSKKSDKKPKFRVVFSNLRESVCVPTKVYYGDTGYRTISEKTTFSARVFDENSEEVCQKTKVALKEQSFKESLNNFLVVGDSTVSTIIYIAKKAVEKQLEKEEKQAIKEVRRQESKSNRTELKNAFTDTVKYAVHGFRD